MKDRADSDYLVDSREDRDCRLSKLYSEFTRFERENLLFEKKIRHVYFWEITRYRLFLELARRKGIWKDYQAIQYRQSIKSKVSYFLKMLSGVHRWFVQPRKVTVLMIGHPRRKKMDDGYYWDLYFDLLSLFCTKNNIEFEYCEPPFAGGPPHFRPAKTARVCYLDLVTLGQLLMSRFPLLLTVEEKVYLDKLSGQFSKAFGTSISLDRSVKDALKRFKAQKALWGTMLSMLRTKHLFFVSGDGKEGLIQAAKEKGVNIVELQHGSPASGKVNYDYDMHERPKRYFANYFLAFGKYWIERNSWPIERENVISFGFPFFSTNRVVLNYRDKEDWIVFIGQPSIGIELSKFAVDIADGYSGKFRIYYKLHPGEERDWKVRYPWLDRPDIDVVGEGEWDLYALLARTRIQVGVYSTAIYEGLGFGCQTALFDAPGVEFLQDLANKGIATIVSNQKEFAEFLEQSQHQLISGEYFFDSGWEEKFVKLIGHAPT